MSPRNSIQDQPDTSYVEVSDVGSGDDQPADWVAPPSKNRFSYIIPAWMIGSFIAGVLFATGHHIYYSKLAGTVVGSTARQQWPIRFGTAFAFLVKTCLAGATGTAYVQWAWRRCYQRAISIGAIDAALAVGSDFSMFFNLAFLFEFSVVVGLAVILWSIPLSALVTPATLGVISQSHSTLHTMLVNQPYFNASISDLYLLGSNPDLDRLFNIISRTGDVAQLSAPQNFQNVSYTLDLFIPVLRCQVSNETIRSWTIAQAFDNALYNFAGSPSIDYEQRLHNITQYPQNLTFTATLSEGGIYPNGSELLETVQAQIGYYAYYGNTTLADIWIAIANPSNGTNVYDVEKPLPTGYSASFYSCTFRNASVTAQIDFVGNNQSIQTSNVKELEFTPYGYDPIAYQIYTNYEKVAQSIYKLIFGLVLNERITYLGSPNPSLVWETNLDQMIFGTASDFSAMAAAWTASNLGFEKLPQSQNKSFTALIEEFSLNASLSLLSLPGFTEQKLTQVNQTLWINKYTYEPRNLFIAYGISILACLLTIIAGLYAIFVNGGGRHTSFSSISEVMQSPDIATLFGHHSMEPLAYRKKINGTKIHLFRDGPIERFRIDKESKALNPQ